MRMRAAASWVEVDWESMPAPADRAAPQVLPPQERSEAHRPPCSTRRETSRACHPSAPAKQARTSIGHTPRAREGVSEQGETHRPPAAGFTLFDYLYLRAGRKGEVPLGVLRAGGGPSVLRDCQLLGLVLHHLGGHGDNAACLAKLLVGESPARPLLATAAARSDSAARRAGKSAMRGVSYGICTQISKLRVLGRFHHRRTPCLCAGFGGPASRYCGAVRG